MSIFTLLRRLLPAAIALAFATGAASATETPRPTYRSIPLDCGGWFSGFSMHSSGRLYGFGDVFGMWRSDDGGLSWKYLQGDFITFDHFINGSAVSTANPDVVAFLSSSKVFKSSDGGTTWTQLLDQLSPRRDRAATALIFHPGNDHELWLASVRHEQNGSLWRSTDGGATWSKAGGSTFDGVVATGINIRPEFPDQVWVGAVGGLYVSADRGATFTRVWDNTGGDAPFTGAKATVGAIARRADGVGYIATNTKGWRIIASDYADPSTYEAVATVSWWQGWGPTTASVLHDGSFLTNGPRENGRPDNDPESLMRSTDGGLTWKHLPMQLITPPTPSWRKPALPGEKADGGRDMIVQDPANPNRWHMTGGAAPVISEDAGSTWRFPPNANGLAGVPTFKVRFPRNNPSLVLLPAADQGGYTVTDGGASGTVASCIRTSIGNLQTYHEILSSDDGRTLVVGGSDQAPNTTLLARSTDYGATWTRIDLTNSGLPPSYDGITRAVAAPGNINDFIVLLAQRDDAAPNHPGLYRTTDGGVTFHPVQGIDLSSVDTGMRYHPENSWLETDGINLNTRYLSVRSSPRTTSGGLWRSTDSGATWAKTPGQPFGDSWIHCLAVDPATAGRLWVAGDSQGVRRSDDGGDTWIEIDGFTKSKRLDAARRHVAVWGRRGSDTWDKIYYSADDGRTWSEQTGPGHRFPNLSDLAINPYLPSEIWVSGMSFNIITVAQPTP